VSRQNPQHPTTQTSSVDREKNHTTCNTKLHLAKNRKSQTKEMVGDAELASLMPMKSQKRDEGRSKPYPMAPKRLAK
jgi:hypothetical protein